MSRTVDYDAFRREQRDQASGGAEPHLFRIGGTEYEMPAELPAPIALDVVRIKRDLDDGGEVPVELLFVVGDELFGAGTFREILSTNRVTMREMGLLIIEALRVYDPSAGEDAVPNRAARRAKRSTSSRTGTSSSRTSSASTDST